LKPTYKAARAGKSVEVEERVPGKQGLKLHHVLPDALAAEVEERVPGKQGLKLPEGARTPSLMLASKSEFQENKD